MPRIVVETGGTDWLTPLATLLAVLIGGVVSWLAQSRLAERRAAFERESQEAADRQQLENEARAAARVLESDLSAASSRLQSIVQRQRWLSFQTLAPGSWRAGQASLAKRLDPDAWSALAKAVTELGAIDDLMRAAIGDGGPHAGASSVPLTPRIGDRLQTVQHDTARACELLAEVSGTAGAPTQGFGRSAARTPS